MKATGKRDLSIFIVISMVMLSVLAGCSDTSSGEVSGADPGVLEAPIAFVKRPIPLNDNGTDSQQDIRDPLFFAAGGDVYLRSNSTASAVETNITASITGGNGDVKDLKPSFDGTRLLFSLRLEDPNPNDDITPRWNIHEYDLITQQLRPIISDSLRAEQGDDVMPAYLPDGRIIFSSNRQTQSGEVLTNEGRDRFSALAEDRRTQAMVLHVMSDQGQEIRQLSFNQSHDLYPTVLTMNYSGQVLYTRWDNAGSNNAMHLYRMTPDGSEVELSYGAHSHATGNNNAGSNNAVIQFTRPQEMQDGRILTITRPFTGTFGGGNLVIIDMQNYVDNNRTVTSMIGMPGTAQSIATINDVSSANELSAGGRYSSAFPLWDGSNRLLVSKSSCTLRINDVLRPCIEPFLSQAAADNNDDNEEASPTYAIWLYDMGNDSEKVIVRAETNTVITDIVALQSRPLPAIISDQAGDSDWENANIGAIHIRSVYDFGNGNFDGCFLDLCTDAIGINSVNDLGDPTLASADQRPARFVRFEKAVPLPDEDDPLLVDPPDLDNDAFGRDRNQGMREIVGYAPVEPDGSVKALVPANVPLAVSVLDDKGRRIGARHQNWFWVKPGTVMECTGCHTHNTSGGANPEIHHRRDAEVASINPGVPTSGIYENTLIPGPGTPEPYFGDIGLSMAEVRFIRAPNQPQLSADIIFDDVWTDPAKSTPNAAFSYQYAMLQTPIPSNNACDPWDYKCRIVINYNEHIHPLWSVDRGVNTCINCHSAFDNVLMQDRVPDGQLDLTDGDSDQNANHSKSYRELLFNDAGEELDATGMLVNIQIEVPVLDENGDQVLDIDGNPVTEFIDDPAARVNPSMSANGARGSYFIEKMTETELDAGRVLTAVTDPDYVDHSGLMSDHELKLISEWLDIGAQYFNNPFDPLAPMN